MDAHFRAFSFVDRIVAVEGGLRIRGRYTIPAAVQGFPGSLVAEAVGQLAAWAAMAAHQFTRRPIAGLASQIELLAAVQPGQELELAADLEMADEDAVAYGGSASVNGTPVIRLQHCVGPMVLAAEFDDPQALRDRYALLCGPGAIPGAFSGLPVISCQHSGGEPGRRATAVLRVPAAAPFFADHFPRRPVFPGSLLMHSCIQLAAELAATSPAPTGNRSWTLRAISDMKLRAFIPPGEDLELEARIAKAPTDILVIAVQARRSGDLAGSARLDFLPGAPS